MEVTRRNFMVAASVAAMGAKVPAVEEKVNDGGFAPVTLPGAVARKIPLVPPGAKSLAAFQRKCIGCLLCVSACPENVLKPSSRPGRFTLPEMDFTRGYCVFNCGRCGEVCPSGAIVPISSARRAHLHIGKAAFYPERCLAAKGEIVCDACVRHCPVKAIYALPLDPAKPNSKLVPVVDAASCVGCGACEHVCPARPMPALAVEGFAEHREPVPMGEMDVLAEAKRVIKEGKAAIVVYREGVFTAHASGRGIAPLLKLYDDDLAALKGAVVVDKVVGRAAAAICVVAGVRQVYGCLMSEGAKQFLAAKGIPAEAEKIVPEILNREQKGLCPLEKAVKGIDDPAKMLAAIRKRLKSLAAKKQS